MVHRQGKCYALMIKLPAEVIKWVPWSITYRRISSPQPLQLIVFKDHRTLRFCVATFQKDDPAYIYKTNVTLELAPEKISLNSNVYFTQGAFICANKFLD